MSRWFASIWTAIVRFLTPLPALPLTDLDVKRHEVQRLREYAKDALDKLNPEYVATTRSHIEEAHRASDRANEIEAEIAREIRTLRVVK